MNYNKFSLGVISSIADGVHALQLEDGTTAYITHPSAISLFGDSTLDSGPINLDQFANQVFLMFL